MTPEELQELNDLISPLILKGQPLSQIFAVHVDEIPVCRRTLYNYLDQRIFQARNIDLPRRVRYKKRRKKSEPRKGRNLQQVYRNKRTYVDFERFMEAHPGLDVVEMDTVKGGRDKGKYIYIILPLFSSLNSYLSTIIDIKTPFKSSYQIIITQNIHLAASIPCLILCILSKFKKCTRLRVHSRYYCCSGYSSSNTCSSVPSFA